MTPQLIWRPSDAKRWVNCPGAVTFTGLLAPYLGDDSTVWTHLGSLFSEAVHQTWNGDESIRDAIELGVSDLSPKACDHIEMALTLYRCLEKKVNGKGVTEVGIPSFYDPEYFCTPDFQVLGTKGLAIVDLKYGFLEVQAEENLQMSIYAASIAATLVAPDDFPVYLSIYQPNLKTGDAVSTEEITLGELRERAVAIGEAYLESKRSLKLSSGDHCQYCPCKDQCPERQNRVSNIAAMLLDGTVLDHGRLMAERKFFKGAISQIEKSVLARLFKGETIPGVFLGTGRGGNRKWADPDAAEAVLVKAAQENGINPSFLVKRELVSPSQVEELGVPFDPKLVTRSPAGPKLSLEGSKDKKFVPADGAAFTDSDMYDE